MTAKEAEAKLAAMPPLERALNAMENSARNAGRLGYCEPEVEERIKKYRDEIWKLFATRNEEPPEP